MGRMKNPELDAVRRVTSVLEPLPPKVRKRVIRFVDEHYGDRDDDEPATETK